MKKLILTILVEIVVISNSGGISVAPLTQNVTKTLLINLETLSIPFEGGFWALLAIRGAVGVLTKSLVPLENYEVGVWTYNLIENNNFVWADKSYPTRDLNVMTSYFHDPHDGHETWTRRLQFTTIDQYTKAEKTTINWDTTKPPFNDFNYLKVDYTRIALPSTHDTTFHYIATGKTMFYCIRRGGSGYPRPLRCTTSGLGWRPKFQQDSMKKYFTIPYSHTQWILIGPDGFNTWMPDPPSEGNVEWHDIGESTAFYQFPAPKG